MTTMKMILVGLLATIALSGADAGMSAPAKTYYSRSYEGCPYYTDIYDPYMNPDYSTNYYNTPSCASYRYAIEPHDVKCDRHARYRTLDGTCNNLFYPKWGSVGQTQLRWLPPAYDDGVTTPRLRQTNGEFLPKPREVSVLVHDNQNNFHPFGSVFLMQWGQFINHDIAATPRDRDGATEPCCADEYVVNMTLHPDILSGGACFPIIIPEGDRHFTNVSTRCISFIRSRPDTSTGVRQQLNLNSAYIDGTTVYGPNSDTLNMLRNFTGGRLRVMGMDNLPESTTSICRTTEPGDYCLKAGDFRVNQFPPLGALHTIFMRYHNYLAGELALANPSWDDETLFQEARRINIAVIQRITYDEYLPLILGKQAMQKFGLKTMFQYNAYCDATLHNAFSAAAFRFGHSMIPDFIHINMVDVSSVLLWFSVNPVLQSLDSLINGTATGRAESADRWFSLAVTDRLFERGPQQGSDLVSRNIQRGRDHGIPSYNNWRRFCKLPPIENFDDLPNGLELRELYNSVEDIDLFTGAMSERTVKSIGPTFTCLVAMQFRNLRDCDRFFWETTDPKIGFTAAQRAAIRKTSLSDVICLTTSVTAIQGNAFKVNRNRLRSCQRIRRFSMDVQGLFGK